MKKTVNIWEYKCYYYCLQLKLRQGNIFTGVWQSFCSRRRGGGVSQHALGRRMYPSMHWGCVSQHALGRQRGKCVSKHALGGGGCIPACTGADTPPEQTYTPWVDTPSPWADTLPPPTMATATNGTHPTGIHSCCHCL